MDLATIAERLDGDLDVGEYSDVDPASNGLQVGPDDAEVKVAAVAVDAAQVTIEAAAAANADLLVVHHGLIWGGIERVTGRAYRRLASLIRNDIALYAAHLPLDGHQALGNAAGIANLLGLDDRRPFGRVGDQHVGQRGTLPEPVTDADLAAFLSAHLDTGGQDVHVLDFGPATIESVAIVTGAGAEYLDAAADAGVDALVTGEGPARVYHQAREREITVVLAGHYATETPGVRAIGDRLREWGLDVHDIDHPTGL